MKTILFVCTGNTCRSSMAEALFKDFVEREKHDLGDIKIISAGTNAIKGDRASFPSIEIMGEKGISLENHKAQPLTKELIDEADLILTMTTNHKGAVLDIAPEAKEKLYTLKEYVNNGEKLNDILDEMNGIYKKIEVKKQQFMMENQKKLKELRDKREALLGELENIDEEVRRIEGDFRETIREYEEELGSLKARVPEMDILDPFGQPLNAYRQSARDIEEALQKLLKKYIKK
ncbi:low molecular weight protein arginine phosphatase [Natronincola ferrireducens]|uniref:Protein-tyrosine phosphatase n=1 Tax=Natronincola ferrireducens TaxID=393762 RepID=A0A1G8XEI5_9FIRM|nr:low molecular weight protein arginine phosphatase [Natronincola ferrireducens]SDJ88365.1 protein-tyrosine phosphatase [Natronincola ferrireducens]